MLVVRYAKQRYARCNVVGDVDTDVIEAELYPTLARRQHKKEQFQQAKLDNITAHTIALARAKCVKPVEMQADAALRVACSPANSSVLVMHPSPSASKKGCMSFHTSSSSPVVKLPPGQSFHRSPAWAQSQCESGRKAKASARAPLKSSSSSCPSPLSSKASQNSCILSSVGFVK